MITKNYIIQTARLGLRNWKMGDLNHLVALNANAAVMEYFPNTMTRKQTEGYFRRIQQHFSEFGYGAYAVEELDSKKFVGLVGFNQARFKAAFTPCVEIAWRLCPSVWNQGYATEAAQACLVYGWQELDFKEVYSFTALPNQKSAHLMQKIGMQKVGEFDHPNLKAGHWLKRHVLYKKSCP